MNWWIVRLHKRDLPPTSLRELWKMILHLQTRLLS